MWWRKRKEEEKESDAIVRVVGRIRLEQTHPAVRCAGELLTKRATCPQVFRKLEERVPVITCSYLYRPYLLNARQMVQAPCLPLGPTERAVPKDGAASFPSGIRRAELALARKHRSIMVFVISPASGLTEGSKSAEECLAEPAPEQREGKEEEWSAYSQHPGQGILLNAFLAAVPPLDPTAQRRHRAKRPDQDPIAALLGESTQ
ncbi:hypothetical protein MHYP_G00053870 [Metynnis hypsauchen]